LLSSEYLMSLSFIDGVDSILRDNIRSAHQSFKLQIDKYFNEGILDFWLYKVAAFLDSRGFCALSPAQWTQAFNHIKLLCTDDEIYSC